VNYRTTCPHCTSVFRIGADQLDAAQGWAQCGVCGAAFDARPSLLMEDGSPLPAATEPAQTVAPTVEAPAPKAIPPVEAVATNPSAAVAAEVPVASAGSDAPQAAETPAGIVQREASYDLPSIILIDPDIAVPDDFGPMPQIQATPAAGPSAAPLMYPPPYSREPAAAAVAAPVTRVEYGAPQDVFPQPAGSYDQPAPRRNRSWAWGSASVLLLALLLAQSAYFLRDTLVSQLPQTRPGLDRMCDLLGCSLSLPKNLALLQIVGSDLETEASGRLRLTLTDQRNRPLARRSFAPTEYLGDAQRIAAGMPPSSEQPLSLPLTVHGLKPMGFDLQLVY
jgi:predicted Zn finger-like uncharacterized protein